MYLSWVAFRWDCAMERSNLTIDHVISLLRAARKPDYPDMRWDRLHAHAQAFLSIAMTVTFILVRWIVRPSKINKGAALRVETFGKC